MNSVLNITPLKAAILLGVCAFLGGFAGIISVILCYAIIRFGGLESADKHGIAKTTAVRIGGILVLIYVILNTLFQDVAVRSGLLDTRASGVLLASLPFFCLGLYEDLAGHLTARFRLVAMLLFGAALLMIVPDHVPVKIGVPFVDAMLQYKPLAWVFACVALAFLVNAFNTADGANGLLSGTVLIIAIVLSAVASPDHAVLLRNLAVGCALFLVYNLSTGRFYLGDGGAYFLGAFVGISLLAIVRAGSCSPWFLVSLICYPVFDLFFAMVRRFVTGGSAFVADNKHFHNELYSVLLIFGVRPVIANTLTGLIIVAIFPGGVALSFWGLGVSATSVLWGYILSGYVLCYVGLWMVLSRLVLRARLAQS